jgi:hypothetical protein
MERTPNHIGASGVVQSRELMELPDLLWQRNWNELNANRTAS